MSLSFMYRSQIACSAIVICDLKHFWETMKKFTPIGIGADPLPIQVGCCAGKLDNDPKVGGEHALSSACRV